MALRGSKASYACNRRHVGRTWLFEPIRVLGLWLMRGRETYSPCASLGFEIGQKILRIMQAGIFVDRQWHGDCNGKS